MKGRVWIIGGAVVGLVVALTHLQFVYGATVSLTNAAQSIVGSVANKIVSASAQNGAPKRVVQAISVLVALAIPGFTALFLIFVAKSAARVRVLLGAVLAVFGVLAYAYEPKGIASGALVLGLGVAAVAIGATGPFLVAPLSAMAGLIAGSFLPNVLSSSGALPNAPVETFNQAVFGSTGAPIVLRVALMIVCCTPFAYAAKMALK